MRQIYNRLSVVFIMATNQDSDSALDYVTDVLQGIVSDESHLYRVVLPNLREHHYMDLLKRLRIYDKNCKKCCFFRSMYPIARVSSDIDQDCYQYKFEDATIKPHEWLDIEMLVTNGKRVSWAALERLLKRVCATNILSPADKKQLKKDMKSRWSSSDEPPLDRVRAVLAMLRIRPARCLTKRFIGTYEHDESISIINELNRGKIEQCTVRYEKSEDARSLDKLHTGMLFARAPRVERLRASARKIPRELTVENENQVIFRLHEDCGLVFRTDVPGATVRLITRCVHEHRELNMIVKVHPPRYEVAIELECSKRVGSVDHLLNHYARAILFTLKAMLVQPTIMLKQRYIAIKRFIETMQTHVSLRKPHTLTLETALARVTNQYAVTAKADGERYWFCCVEAQGYLISVKGKIIETGPTPEALNHTVVDGELIWIGRHRRYVFLAFDILYCRGVNLTKPTGESRNGLRERLQALDETLVELGYPFTFHKRYVPGRLGTKLDLKKIGKEMAENLKRNDDMIRRSKRKFVFLRKYYAFPVGEQANDVYRLIDAVWKCYENLKVWTNDGVILTPIQQAYNPGPRGIPEFKLKPLREMSIDFLLKIQSRQNTGRPLPVFDATLPGYDRSLPAAERPQYCVGFLHVVKRQQTRRRDADKETVEFRREMGDHQVHLPLNPLTGLPEAMNGDVIQSDHVVEFIWKNDAELPRERRWIPLRVRHDKTVGNGMKNADTIFNIITHPNQQITFADVKAMCGKNFSAVKQRMYQRLKQTLDIDGSDKQSKQQAYLDYVTMERFIVKNVIAKVCAPVQEPVLRRFKHNGTRPQQRHKKVVDVNFDSSYIEYYASAKVQKILSVSVEQTMPNEAATVDRLKEKYSKEFDWNLSLNLIRGDFKRPMVMDEQSTHFSLTTEESNVYRNDITERPSFNAMLCLRNVQQYFESSATLATFLDNVQRCVVPGGYLVLMYLDAEALLAEPRNESSRMLQYSYMDDLGNLKPVVEVNFSDEKIDLNHVTTGATMRLLNTMTGLAARQEYLVNHSYLTKMLQVRDFQCYDTMLFRDFYKHQQPCLQILKQFLRPVPDMKERLNLEAMTNFLTRQSMVAQAIRRFTGLFRCTVFMRTSG